MDSFLSLLRRPRQLNFRQGGGLSQSSKNASFRETRTSDESTDHMDTVSVLSTPPLNLSLPQSGDDNINDGIWTGKDVTQPLEEVQSRESQPVSSDSLSIPQTPQNADTSSAQQNVTASNCSDGPSRTFARFRIPTFPFDSDVTPSVQSRLETKSAFYHPKRIENSLFERFSQSKAIDVEYLTDERKKDMYHTCIMDEIRQQLLCMCSEIKLANAWMMVSQEFGNKVLFYPLGDEDSIQRGHPVDNNPKVKTVIPDGLFASGSSSSGTKAKDKNPKTTFVHGLLQLASGVKIPLSYNPNSTQAFRVIMGQLMVILEGTGNLQNRPKRCVVNDEIHIPPNVRFGFENTGYSYCVLYFAMHKVEEEPISPMADLETPGTSGISV